MKKLKIKELLNTMGYGIGWHFMFIGMLMILFKNELPVTDWFWLKSIGIIAFGCFLVRLYLEIDTKPIKAYVVSSEVTKNTGWEIQGTLKAVDVEVDGIIYTYIAGTEKEVIESLYRQISELESEIERMKD